MNIFLTYTVLGFVIGASYAIAASGLVLTYATTRIFNVAHGATAMFMAFVYWELAYNQGLSDWLSVLLVVFVIAPLFGALLERWVIRRVADAGVGVTLVVTCAVLVGLIGAAEKIWPPGVHSVTMFFAGHGVRIGKVHVSGNDLLTIGLAVAAGAVLFAFLTFTRTGVAMRAAVDDKELLALHGGRPHLMAALAWAMGSALAALAGILLVSARPSDLNYISLTLLVVNSYAAAMAGRLTSLPRTFIGALVLGLLNAYASGYLWTGTAWTGFREAIPAIFLLLMLLLMPQAPLRVGRLSGVAGVRTPEPRRIAIASAALVLAVVIGNAVLSTVNVNRMALGLCFAILALSLVPLTGFSGYVSLAQFSFFGVGALTVAKTHSSAPTALLLGALLAAVAGILVALPSLRLQGLYLALSTIAFAQIMDSMVFQNPSLGGFGGSLRTKRLDLFGYRFTSDKAYALLAAAVFCVIGILVIGLRKGRYGRILIALRDSPAACATLGLNPRLARVAVFAGSAAIAGLGGGLYAGLQNQVGSTNFQFFNSLPLLLIVVCAGVTSVSGALLGGMLLMALNSYPSTQAYLFLILAIAAVGLGKQPNGIMGWLFDLRDHPVAGRLGFGSAGLARSIAASAAGAGTGSGTRSVGKSPVAVGDNAEAEA
ncbi:MAG: ABC transporter permease [Catenulispora sp.]|nr:ABC transporter permease [Catenulispora sp.]